jgi:hypothetical protein
MRVNAARFVNEFVDKLLDARHATPADDLGGDFVDDAESEEGGMIFAGGDGLANGSPRFRLRNRRVEKTKVFGPRDVHKDLQAVLVEQVEEPAGRHVVNPEHVGAQLLQLRQVAARRFAQREHLPVRVCGERTIRDASDIILLRAKAEEFAIHSDAVGRWRGGSHGSAAVGSGSLLGCALEQSLHSFFGAMPQLIFHAHVIFPDEVLELRGLDVHDHCRALEVLDERLLIDERQLLHEHLVEVFAGFLLAAFVQEEKIFDLLRVVRTGWRGIAGTTITDEKSKTAIVRSA